MIICPYDRKKLEYNNERLFCNSCNYQVLNKNGTFYFNPEIDSSFEDYDAAGLDVLFKAEQKHFWFKSRRRIILDYFKRYIQKSDSIIEIGAGTGSIARMLIKNGYDVSVGEIHSSGLEYARSYGVKKRYQFDLMKTPFLDHFDVIGMFDVLEHLDDDKLAIKKTSEMLKPGGKVIITVPAHMWLWNREDSIAHHKRRYTVSNLVDVFTSNNMEVIKVKTIFISIIPLLFLRRILNPDNGSKPKKDEYQKEIKINSTINFFLDAITKLEYKLLKNFSTTVGGSIILIAKKRL